jgi:type I restriction enzyme, S subunit
VSTRAWRSLPLKAILRRRDETGRSDLPLLSVYRDLGVVPREGREDNFNRPGEDLSTYRVVRPGDLVMNKMKTWQGSLGISEWHGIVSPAYFVCELSGDVEPRFVHHLLRSRPLIGEYAARSKGIRPAQWDLPWDQFRDICVALPERSDQRAIAALLDAETARIDAVIAAKRRFLEVLDERLRAFVMDELFGAPAKWVRVGRAGDLLPGFAFSSELFSTDAATGIRLLRGINVAPGRIRWDETVYLDVALASETERFQLAVGDLVIGMDRPVIGGGMRVAEITEADVPSLLVQRVARLRVNELAERDWVRLALMSPAFVAYFSPIVTGVSVPHISPDQIASFKLPLPELQQQRSILRRLLRAEKVKDKLSTAAVAQIGLLREHRQALITEAVTGKFDVARVAA